MPLTVVLFAILVLAGPTGRAAATRDPDAGLDRYGQGHLALAGGDLAAARAQFESVPAESILDDYAAFFSAESLLRAGDETAALERFRAFLERFPDSTLAPQAVLALADAAFRLGRWADAEREARRFLKLAPSHPDAGRILVRLAAARGAPGLVAGGGAGGVVTEALGAPRRRGIEARASPWGEVAREVAEDLAKAHGVPFPPLG